MPYNNVNLSCIMTCNQTGCDLREFRECLAERREARRPSWFTGVDYGVAQREELANAIDSNSSITV